MGNRTISLVIISAAASAAACGGRDTQPESPASQRPASDVSELRVPDVDPELCEPSGKEVVTYDLDHDGEPNIWELYKTIDEEGTDVQVMTCKQVDFDGDGGKDYVANYRESGELLAEEFDLTFNGSFDVRSHYDEESGNMVLTERSSDFGESYDVWERYTEDGELELVQRDRNGDGQPDMWEQYEEGELVAILYDDTSDGRVDRREDRPRDNEEDTGGSGSDELAEGERSEDVDSGPEIDEEAPADEEAAPAE